MRRNSANHRTLSQLIKALVEIDRQEKEVQCVIGGRVPQAYMETKLSLLKAIHCLAEDVVVTNSLQPKSLRALDAVGVPN